MEHGMDSTNSVLSRHGIRNILGFTVSIIHSGKDKIREDLEVQGKRRRNFPNLGGITASVFGFGRDDREITVSLGGSVQFENTVGILSVLAILFKKISAIRERPRLVVAMK